MEREPTRRRTNITDAVLFGPRPLTQYILKTANSRTFPGSYTKHRQDLGADVRRDFFCQESLFPYLDQKQRTDHVGASRSLRFTRTRRSFPQHSLPRRYIAYALRQTFANRTTTNIAEMDTPTNSATASPGGGGPIAGGRHHPPPHNHENLVLATVGALPPADRLRTITRLLNGYEAATQENIDRVGRTLEELFGAQDGIHGVPLDVVRDFQAALQNVRLAPGVNRLALRIDIHRRGAGRRHQRRAAMAEMMREAEAEAEAEAERLVAQMLAMGRR